MKYDKAVKGKRVSRSVARFNVMVDPGLLDRLDSFCKENGYKRNQLVDCMLEEFLEKWGLNGEKL